MSFSSFTSANNVDIAHKTMMTDLTPPRSVQFWTILSVEIPSLACTIYLLYHLLTKERLRKALHNHVIVILLLLSFLAQTIDNPLYLDAYLHRGRNSFVSSPGICLLWWLIDYGVYGAIAMFFAWASFERHLLIFYPLRCLNTRRQRILFHYLPLIIIAIYASGFYIGAIIFAPCENTFDYELEACGISPCYEEIPWLNFWANFLNGVLCTWIEALCSVSLLIRILYRRYRTQRLIHWRKHRKMTIQLLSITTLSLSITFPQTLIITVQQTIPGMQEFAVEVGWYFFYLTTFVVLFLPFIALGCLSELWPSRWALFRRRRERIIFPLQLIIPR